MTRCLSAMRLHLGHTHSLKEHRFLWPFNQDITPWFLHRAHFGRLPSELSILSLSAEWWSSMTSVRWRSIMCDFMGRSRLVIGQPRARDHQCHCTASPIMYHLFIIKISKNYFKEIHVRLTRCIRLFFCTRERILISIWKYSQ